MSRTLSSPLTFVYKFVFSLLFAVVFACCVVTCVKLVDNPLALPAALLGAVLFFGAFIHLASLKKVVLRDGCLVVSNFVRSRAFPLSTITSVRGSAFFNHHPVWVRFRLDGGRAKTIVFMPPLLFIFFRVHPLVEELESSVLLEQNSQ